MGWSRLEGGRKGLFSLLGDGGETERQRPFRTAAREDQAPPKPAAAASPEAVGLLHHLHLPGSRESWKARERARETGSHGGGPGSASGEERPSPHLPPAAAAAAAAAARRAGAAAASSPRGPGPPSSRLRKGRGVLFRSPSLRLADGGRSHWLDPEAEESEMGRGRRRRPRRSGGERCLETFPEALGGEGAAGGGGGARRPSNPP